MIQYPSYQFRKPQRFPLEARFLQRALQYYCYSRREAITVGLPILCFNTCGFGPIVKDFAGITVELSNPYKSVQDFAHELSLLYQNRAVLNDISTRMLEKRQELTWEAKAKKLVRHYEEILKK